MVLSSLFQLYGSYFGHAQHNICLVVVVVVVLSFFLWIKKLCTNIWSDYFASSLTYLISSCTRNMVNKTF